MKNHWNRFGIISLAAISLLSGFGCKPRTPAQKVEDKMEDVGHEINQGVERTQENMKRK